MTKMAILLIEFQVWGIKFRYIECSICNEIASQCQICYSACNLEVLFDNHIIHCHPTLGLSLF